MDLAALLGTEEAAQLLVGGAALLGGLAEEGLEGARVADQIAALVSLIALVNAANRLAVIVHQPGGSYEAGMFAAAVS